MLAHATKQLRQQFPLFLEPSEFKKKKRWRVKLKKKIEEFITSVGKC